MIEDGVMNDALARVKRAGRGEAVVEAAMARAVNGLIHVAAGGQVTATITIGTVVIGEGRAREYYPPKN